VRGPKTHAGIGVHSRVCNLKFSGGPPARAARGSWAYWQTDSDVRASDRVHATGGGSDSVGFTVASCFQTPI
jgi:hypothetical protein